MEAVELTEAPSAARRRLSVALGAGAHDAVGLAEAARRGSVIALEHPSVVGVAPDAAAELAAAAEAVSDESGPSTKTTGQQPAARRGVSIKPHRASAFSRGFALSSTSESFMKEDLRPTLINGMIFLADPEPDIDKLRDVLAERLLCIPRFRCTVKRDAKGNVTWEPLPRPDVNMTEHVKLVDGKGDFDEDDIEDLVNDAFLSHYPASKPLWRMTLVTNLKDGRSLLFAVIDHAIGDGVGLLAVFLSLFDDNFDPAASSSSAVAAGGAAASSTTLQKKRKTPQGLRWSHLAVAFVRGTYDGIVNTLVPPSDPPSSLLIPKDRLKDPCPGKDFAQTKAFPVDDIKAMKNKIRGATVNDIVLALLTMAIRSYYEKTGDSALAVVQSGRGKIRGDFPVNMRKRGKDAASAADDAATSLGNNICVASFVYPLHYADPIDCVWRCKTSVDELKVSPAFALRKVLGDFLFGMAPDAVLAPQILDLMNRSTCMISNVAGPAGSSSLGGYDIDDLNFTASYLGALYFGVLSFGGNLRISAILDRRTKADVRKLIDCFEASYEELEAALEGVDEREPLARPDMTPIAARFLEAVVYAAVVAVPIFVGMRFMA